MKTTPDIPRDASLKIGELARRTGLTVRTLHHYDHIGLLKPSGRSDAGYRLYTRDDISRLHQIQAMQRLGLTLADIAAARSEPQAQLPQLIAQQLRMLDQYIAQATLLRERLLQLQTQLDDHQDPELADWLKTLELMNMYDKYFTPEELQRLPINLVNQTTHPEWAAVINTVNELMSNHTPSDSPEARAAAKQWFTIVERDIAGDPVLLAKLTEMHYQEPEIQKQSGATPAMVKYIQQASIHDKLDIYEKYLLPEEFAYVRANYGKRIAEWPPLIASVYAAMQNNLPTDGPEVRKLALHWLDLFRSYAGDNPDTQQKLRLAHEREPGLLIGSLISPALLAYMRQAFAQLHMTK